MFDSQSYLLTTLYTNPSYHNAAKFGLVLGWLEVSKGGQRGRVARGTAQVHFNKADGTTRMWARLSSDF